MLGDLDHLSMIFVGGLGVLLAIILIFNRSLLVEC